jgi:hypothetical protein
MTTNITQLARLCEQHGDLLGAKVAAAVTKLHEQTGGYPSRSSGSDGGGSADATSTTERRALSNQRDAAATDLANLADLLATAERALIDVLDICRRADPRRRLTTTDVGVAARLAEAGDIWCDHHLTLGRMTPRKGDHRNCGWCDSFRQANGSLPPKPLVEMHDQGKRITSADITRALGKAVA